MKKYEATIRRALLATLFISALPPYYLYAATISGRVTSTDGKPLKEVTVSDGTNVTVTDSKGLYSLQSDKESGYVFISTPGDYIAPKEGSFTRFYAYTDKGSDKPEKHNFVLTPVDNSKYAIILQTDQHLTNRGYDMEHFRNNFLPDVNNTIDSLKTSGYQVYSLDLGDLSWDFFWYSRNFTIADAANELNKVNCTIFPAMGNHDNDPYQTDDWQASETFHRHLGPSYYSFNLGDTHVVMLDNVIYTNTGGKTGVSMGKRDYVRTVNETQLEWLKRDLATIKDKTRPLIIAGHVPFHKAPWLVGQEQATAHNIACMPEIEKMLKGFNNVTFFSGHYHRNFQVVSPNLPGTREYNVASVCGALWDTVRKGHTHNNICPDGILAGYGVLTMDGSTPRYRFKSVGCPEDYQFRVYDLNTTRIDESSIVNEAKKHKVKDYAGDYYTPCNDNRLLINVFNFGPGWTIETWEEGRPLEMTRVNAHDPLYIVSYACSRLENNETPKKNNTGANGAANINHMFTTTCSSPSSTVVVTVTDNFGKKYTQTVKRPKAFSKDIR